MLKSTIKLRLVELNMKQRDICKQLGVTEQTFSAWVQNRATPTLEMSFRIAKQLHCKIEDLFLFIDEE
ncbi:helix-turn-helix domain-containing protein [Heyndrickxia oleronia]|uniref:helix-turn-helix transcriptional regulator n=1 Tax=Heyndrickxia oleronia TaxID=38875 RepID=UPI003F215AA0